MSDDTRRRHASANRLLFFGAFLLLAGTVFWLIALESGTGDDGLLETTLLWRVGAAIHGAFGATGVWVAAIACSVGGIALVVAWAVAMQAVKRAMGDESYDRFRLEQARAAQRAQTLWGGPPKHMDSVAAYRHHNRRVASLFALLAVVFLVVFVAMSLGWIR